MDKPDNPARRLHTLYTAFEEHGGRDNDQNKTNAKQAWAEALGLDPGNLSELLAQFGVIVGMPKVIRDRIEELPANEDQELLSRHLPAFEKVFSSHGIHGRVQAYRKDVTAHQLESLESVAVALDRHGAEELSVDQDEVERLRTEVAAIFEEVRTASSLDDDLRRFVLDHLHRIERALRRVQVEGVEGLREALQVLVADIVIDQSVSDGKRGLWDFIRETGSAGARLLTVANQLAQLIALASGAPELAAWVRNALPPGDA